VYAVPGSCHAHNIDRALLSPLAAQVLHSATTTVYPSFTEAVCYVQDTGSLNVMAVTVNRCTMQGFGSPWQLVHVMSSALHLQALHPSAQLQSVTHPLGQRMVNGAAMLRPDKVSFC
jgi:hypothetical protein